MTCLWWDKLTNRWAVLSEGVVRTAVVVDVKSSAMRSRTRTYATAPNNSVPMAWLEIDGEVVFVGDVATVTEKRT